MSDIEILAIVPNDGWDITTLNVPTGSDYEDFVIARGKTIPGAVQAALKARQQ